ncbi:hypothetical protein MAPG_01791 [Magnaporthiopsis poae ATCC 64411]|uniref:Uncharacterized protein n=1 Tax=Magnaporthiopsis poae (strain ATCC 64411 / 73-15) TaxID=644358 RepID=A0A0C4DPM2_MAGP6|nr:hypothetical protein MAPG_01791 [Magnaporthiopsis poae ATCC 64411]
MMAQPLPHPPTDKRRVKVYELRNNDWFDRGTGFCTATYSQNTDGDSESEITREPRVIVESEDHPERLLLETRICKEDGFQKQQDTLIVWTEPTNGIDMALSFQEADGCLLIWKFIHSVQASFTGAMAPHEDSLSDDLALELPNPISLPPPELSSLPELEQSIRIMNSSATGREALTKCIIMEDYISRLASLVEMAEDLESLPDLHRLCNIMKSILLLNDTGIIEHAVSDECVLGVVGALEYDPDFPSHKANHRQWLSNQGRYKEVVRIQDELVRRKIHQTYRLQYLKDVVLARILDDPTFSVLNSLIFFNQVDIVQHLQGNTDFLKDLFGIFTDPTAEQLRQKEAVLFIQQCCAIAKNLQPPARQSLYNNFLTHGLLQVVNFGLRNPDVPVRVGATDILVSVIDNDPQMIRQTIYRQLRESQPPLTDTLIDLLLVEVDLGIKSQISDALKVLLDPAPPGPPPEAVHKVNGEAVARRPPQTDPQQEMFLHHFYDQSLPRLFKPLISLRGKTDLDFPVNNDGVFGYLHEILCFYVRQHPGRCKLFVMNHEITRRFMQLMTCRNKHLQLVALRYFRQLVLFKDLFWHQQLTNNLVFAPVLDVLMQTLPRDNLLCSAILEIFDLVGNEDYRELTKHVMAMFADKIQALSYMNPFRAIIQAYEQTRGFALKTAPAPAPADQAQGQAQPQSYSAAMDSFLMNGEEELVAARRRAAMNMRGIGEHITVDPEEEAFWDANDDDDEDAQLKASATGNQPPKPLVDYASDEEGDENLDTEMTPAMITPLEEGAEMVPGVQEEDTAAGDSTGRPTPPVERISEKRRREEDEEDELGKLLQNSKRRNSSSASMNSTASIGSTGLRKKKGMGGSGRDSPNGASKKIAISISPSLKLAAGQTTADDAGQ